MNNKNIMIVADSPVFSSGVGNCARHMAKKFVNDGNRVVCIGVIANNNRQEITPPTLHKFDGGEEVIIYESAAYDNLALYDYIIKNHKIDAIVIQTDPFRYRRLMNYSYLYLQKIGIYWVSVWDTDLVNHPMGKPHWNKDFYESVSRLGCISKQTEWFINTVLEKSDMEKKPVVEYVGHGSDPSVYKPVPPQDLIDIKQKLFRGIQYDFVAFFNSRNQNRKKACDLLMGFRYFTESLPPEQAAKCAILLQTDVTSEYGTNLAEFCAEFTPLQHVYINNDRVPEAVLNKFYNIADVTCNVSNAEGFGLSCGESLLAGTPVIANATGGLVDQIGFYDEGGNTPRWTPEFKKNLKNMGHGTHAYPLFGQNTIIGNPETIALFDSNASIEDIAAGLKYWYELPPYERKRRGLKGREYMINNELTSEDFAAKVAKGTYEMMESFVPQTAFSIYKG